MLDNICLVNCTKGFLVIVSMQLSKMLVVCVY